jgi:adenosylcobinamide-phosphate synthase
MITALDQRLNREDLPQSRRRINGVATAAAVIACGAGFGWTLEQLAYRSRHPRLLSALLATAGLAQRSLHDHVTAVQRPLRRGDLVQARIAVAKIVGRDVEGLDEAGVATAALESLAESFNDGVVAPAFWLAVAGLPGLYAYKALNTADSLIGHREPRWRAFGWASARADDLANLLPARLAGGLIALAGRRGWRTMVRDAPRHASPNAGWTEAAMAGALKVRLGGPVTYDGVPAARPVFGDGAPPPLAGDLSRGLAIYRRACVLLVIGMGAYGLAKRWKR